MYPVLKTFWSHEFLNFFLKVTIKAGLGLWINNAPPPKKKRMSYLAMLKSISPPTPSRLIRKEPLPRRGMCASRPLCKLSVSSKYFLSDCTSHSEYKQLASQWCQYIHRVPKWHSTLDINCWTRKNRWVVHWGQAKVISLSNDTTDRTLCWPEAMRVQHGENIRADINWVSPKVPPLVMPGGLTPSSK